MRALRSITANPATSMRVIKIVRVSIQALQLWAACFALLTVHAWFFLSLEGFLTAGLAYPFLLFLTLGLFTWFYKPGEIEQANKEDVTRPLATVFLLMPVILTIYACAVGQFLDDYEKVTWVGIVMGGYLGQQTAELVRMRRGAKKNK